jgi:hypothetical protein
MSKFSVRVATLAQLRPVFEERAVRHAKWAREALNLRPPAAEPAAFGDLSPEERAPLREVHALLATCWTLPFGARAKETLWLLVLDGVNTLARLHLPASTQCLCGAPALAHDGALVAPGRRHFFWECPPACEVISALTAALTAGGQPLAAPLSCDALWLGRPPVVSDPDKPAISPKAWALLCLACFGGMAAGKRSLGAVAVRARVARRTLNAAELADAVSSAGKAAVRAFWATLEEVHHWRPKQPWADALRTCCLFKVVGGDAPRGPYSRARITLLRPDKGPDEG